MTFTHFFAAGILGVALSATSAAVSAQQTVISGKKDLVCATQDIMACVDGPICAEGSASSFDLPAFMFVDVKKKQVRSVNDDGSSVASPVRDRDITERSVILQGFENHKGWTLSIDRADGSYTLSATGPDVNFTVMGACTEL